jgi:transposase
VKWPFGRRQREQALELVRLRAHTEQLQARVVALAAEKARLLAELAAARKHSGNSLEEFLGPVLGFQVCRGYLAKVMARGSRALATPGEELRALLPVQRGLNVDETGHKENGQGLWPWCFRAQQFVVFSMQASRGSDVLLELLGRDFNGVLGCDYFSAYRKFMGQRRGSVPFCFAHLIRDLKFLAGHPEPVMQVYAQPILRAVRRMFHLIHAQGQCPTARADFQSRLEGCRRRRIALATDPTRLSPRAGSVEKRYPEAANLASRFRQHGDAYFTFITTPQLGATNNSAEQALRCVVMDRRATQGTRSHKGRLVCERIWTVVATCRRNQRSSFGFLCEAMTAWANGLQAPSLLPADSS